MQLLRHLRLRTKLTFLLGLSIMALVVACAIGLVYLYDENKTFGGFGSYIGAILWGLGMDTSVRGFAATLGHISPARASV